MSDSDAYQYYITVSGELAHALGDHYRRNGNVSSVPDALRWAGWEAVGRPPE